MDIALHEALNSASSIESSASESIEATLNYLKVCQDPGDVETCMGPGSIQINLKW